MTKEEFEKQDVFCWNGCIFADGMELNKITNYKDAELYINFSA